jgi:hypothetical protein
MLALGFEPRIPKGMNFKSIVFTLSPSEPFTTLSPSEPFTTLRHHPFTKRAFFRVAETYRLKEQLEEAVRRRRSRGCEAAKHGVKLKLKEQLEGAVRRSS